MVCKSKTKQTETYVVTVPEWNGMFEPTQFHIVKSGRQQWQNLNLLVSHAHQAKVPRQRNEE